MRLSIPLFLSAIVLSSCGGSSSDSGLGGATGVAVTDLPDLLANAFCQAATTCYGPLYSAFLNGQDCVATTKQGIVNGDYSQFDALLAKGTVTYDGTKAQACADKIANGGCASLGTRNWPECVATFDGTVATGGACTYGSECKGDAYCAATTTCPGVCSALLAVGAACKVDDDCQNDLYCDANSHQCTKRAAENEACGASVAPECAAGLLCLGQDDKNKKPGACHPIASEMTAAAGASCSFQTGPLCSGTLSCAGQSFSTSTGTLVSTCAQQVAAGAACAIAFPSQCPVGQYCDVPQPSGGNIVVTGTCTALPTDGQACASALGVNSACAPNAVCVSGTCKLKQSNGGACAQDDQCFSSSCQSGSCGAHSACTD